MCAKVLIFQGANPLFNVGSLSKIFKEETGETFVSYLTELRLKEAEKLLKTTELKTYEIAERTGFSDYHHFCKTFKKVTGKTPSDIRG